MVFIGCATFAELLVGSKRKTSKKAVSEMAGSENADSLRITPDSDSTRVSSRCSSPISPTPQSLKNRNGNDKYRFLFCFSLISNFRRLFSSSKNMGNLRCLNGIRVLSILWVILAHSYFFLQLGYDNLQTVFDLRKLLSHQFILASVLGVDTFFFLGGFLSYWTLTQSLNLYSDSTKFGLWKSLPFLYLNRYIRLTPPYLAMILVNLCLWPYLSNGPFYLQETDQYCSENWWTNLIYLNNFIGSTRMCLGWSWYLAVDMQLFLIAPFAVYLFTKRPRLAVSIAVVLLILQSVVAAVLTVIFDLPSTLLPENLSPRTPANGSILVENFPDSAEYLW